MKAIIWCLDLWTYFNPLEGIVKHIKLLSPAGPYKFFGALDKRTYINGLRFQFICIYYLYRKPYCETYLTPREGLMTTTVT